MLLVIFDFFPHSICNSSATYDIFAYFFQALLGAQLAITLVMVSVIQKLSPHFSFARWILCSTGYAYVDTYEKQYYKYDSKMIK